MPTVSSTSNSVVVFTGAEARDILLQAAVSAGGVLPDGGEQQDNISIKIAQQGLSVPVEINPAGTVTVTASDAEGEGTTPVE